MKTSEKKKWHHMKQTPQRKPVEGSEAKRRKREKEKAARLRRRQRG